MAIKVLLYHYGEYLSFMEERYKVIEDALRSFNLEIYQKEFPFRDEASKKFLHKTYNIQYVDDNDRYAFIEAERISAIHDLSSYMKEGLALIKNSQKGYYTHITQTEDRVTSAVTHWDDDLLVALEEAQNSKAGDAVMLSIPAKQLNELISSIFDYTKRLAEANAFKDVRVAAPKRGAKNSMANLQNYLEIQKQIMANAA